MTICLDLPWCDSTGFLDAISPATEFASRLIEPRLDKALPIFVEMPIGDHVVTLTHFGAGMKKKISRKVRRYRRVT